MKFAVADRMQNRRVSAFFAGLLSVAMLSTVACTQVSEIHTADGRPAKMISCQGSYDDLSACHAEAKAACPTGYKTLSTSSDLGDADDHTFTTAPVRQNIVVTCQHIEQEAEFAPMAQ